MVRTVMAVQPTTPAMAEVAAGMPVAMGPLILEGWVQIPEHPSDYRFFSSGKRSQNRTLESE